MNRLHGQKSNGGSSNDHPYGVVTDSYGNIYNMGTYSNTADFDPSSSTVTLNTAGLQDIYVQKLDTDGNLIWVKQFGEYWY